MKKAVLVALGTLLAFGGLSACTKQVGPDPLEPPYQPIKSIAGATLPTEIGGYSVLGSAPATNQLSTTYARDAKPLDLAVVTFHPAPSEYRSLSLADQQWYGWSRCGILWEGDANVTPKPEQSACITLFVDGVMTIVSGGEQTTKDLAQFANAIYEQL